MCNVLKNMAENSKKIWKIWKKFVKCCGKYGRKVG
jgi:hypothetical protein